MLRQSFSVPVESELSSGSYFDAFSSREAGSASLENALEHVPEKWTRFSDKDMLQVFELARILFDQVIPPDRKAR
jgi:hypothetical protein